MGIRPGPCAAYISVPTLLASMARLAPLPLPPVADWSVSRSDISGITETYKILRRPLRGRSQGYLPRDRSGQKADRRVQGCRIGGELAGPTDFLILPAANRSRNRRNCSPSDWSHRPRECRAACRPLIGCQAAKRWFSCNFFHPPDIIVRWCGRIDLVASPPSAKMMANRFGDRQPKRTR